jgi:hypothetical protein
LELKEIDNLNNEIERKLEEKIAEAHQITKDKSVL